MVEREAADNGAVLLVGDLPLVLAGVRAALGRQVVGVVAGGADALREAPLRDGVVVVATPRWDDSYATALETLRARAPAVAVVLVQGAADAGAARRFLAGGGRCVLGLEDGVAALRAAVRREAAQGGAPAAELSAREAAVLRRKAAGHSAKAIAADLGISSKTVETYYARALDKLGLRSRVEVMRHALGQGWIAER